MPSCNICSAYGVMSTCCVGCRSNNTKHTNNKQIARPPPKRSLRYDVINEVVCVCADGADTIVRGGWDTVVMVRCDDDDAEI